MKKNLNLIITLTLIAIAFGLMLWANFIMRNYDGYLEVMRAARRAAAPQFISGLVLPGIAYVLSYKIRK